MYVCVNTLGNLLVHLLLHAFSPLLFFVFLSFTERYHISFVMCMKCIGRCAGVCLRFQKIFCKMH